MIQWRVKLSSGEVFTENIKPFEKISGEKTPWLRLLDYIDKNNLKIVSLSLVDGERVFNLPSKTNRPKFMAFSGLIKPKKFNFYRMLGMEFDKRELFSVIEADYGNYKLQLWVDEYHKNSWVLVK
jgi:hypothetical protein